jgi:hypothetical protein
MARNLLRGLGALAAISILGLPSHGVAEKVGVAAAVNPDAFSSLAGKPQSQLNIGKSIFYNERINTTGSGLVQVLLVDGSTFTVGPGSDLVIDRFVYDPKKGTGQITASFSKGVMRFVGGKISKNEGGVRVDTPAGTLAVRGGITYGQFISPKNYAFLFVFGDYLKMNGLKVFEPGNGIFAQNGQPVIREFTAADVNLMIAALTNNNAAAAGPKPSEGPDPFKLVSTDSMNQLISDANTQQILAEAQEAPNDQTESPPEPPCVGEQCNPPPPPPSCEETGTCPDPDPPSCEETGTCEPPPPQAGSPSSYAAGVYERQGAGQPVKGILRDVLFNPESNSVSFGISDGELVILGFDDAGRPISATVTRGGNPLQVVQFKSQTELAHQKDPICEDCDFLSWGRWEAHLNYKDGLSDSSDDNSTNLFAGGWWVAGELTTTADIDTLAKLGANATYSGAVHGTVINLGERYDASGSLTMNWSFADRSGDLTISNFDNRSYSTGASGLTQPSLDINKFGGSLTQTDGPSIGLTNGSVTGSFVNSDTVAARGVMGNWGVQGNNYEASGVFAGAGTPR